MELDDLITRDASSLVQPVDVLCDDKCNTSACNEVRYDAVGGSGHCACHTVAPSWHPFASQQTCRAPVHLAYRQWSWVTTTTMTTITIRTF